MPFSYRRLAQLKVHQGKIVALASEMAPMRVWDAFSGKDGPKNNFAISLLP